eukprot:1203080-Pleurochrysis_carterae.AAC.3
MEGSRKELPHNLPHRLGRVGAWDGGREHKVNWDAVLAVHLVDHLLQPARERFGYALQPSQRHHGHGDLTAAVASALAAGRRLSITRLAAATAVTARVHPAVGI